MIGSGGSSPGVIILDSTLKQSSLCPGNVSTTFTCTASGTDLVWIVGGTTLPFNRNAIAGRSRTDPERDITATLLHISNAEENGYADRFSVLTARAQLQATEMLSVQCHNGSSNLAEEMVYLPRVAGNYIPRYSNVVNWLAIAS